MKQPGLAGRFVLGAAQLGQSYGNGTDRRPPDAPETAELFRAALNVGIVEIDTVRAGGRREQTIAAALTGQLRRRVSRFVSSPKCSR